MRSCRRVSDGASPLLQSARNDFPSASRIRHAALGAAEKTTGISLVEKAGTPGTTLLSALGGGRDMSEQDGNVVRLCKRHVIWIPSALAV